ncbi:MAG TPA: hypothetical protein DHW77_03390, partial [Verrucomicrobiales bacterium]|nr:hypothetical protein [Verrucomicrobiales bacterium]
MQSPRTITVAIARVFLFGAAAACMAQADTALAKDGTKDREIRKLKTQLKQSKARYHVLSRDLAASKRHEDELSKQVTELKLSFIALRDGLLRGGDQAILNAVKNAEVLDKRNKRIETAVHSMAASLR